ncbi:MAG: glycosyltransferase [Coleofasciculaceae cyanobacterium]
MATSQFDSPRSKRRRFLPRVPLATLVMLGTVLLTGVIVAAWFAGNGTIGHVFAQLQWMQENPPLWLEVPMVTGNYLLFPTVALFLIALGVMKVSPQPKARSRTLVVAILLILAVRYILWRSLSTLNLDNPLDGVFSLGLFVLEMLMLISSTIQLFLMLKVKDRRHESDRMTYAVLDGTFTPSVDILIPSYDEPEFIVRRTLIGCQALEYDRKTIYLLDDTRRPQMRKLAEELGCEYMTRPDNRHAKAGNLNHALTKIQGELIVVFDADFVPTKNFLTRTVGFFQDESVALVQTPQSFYNADPIARNLGLENVVTPEEEVFYRQIEPIKDAAGSVVCSGTSFVVRRSAIEDIGGFVTESLSEDYFTGIRLSARGYRLIYLNEKLSAGLAAENIAAYATQRLRWARGTLQAFFIESNPLTIHGLRPIQRLAHLEGLLHWFTSISRVGFLLMPLAYAFLGVIPIRATPPELLYFFLPYYMVQLAVFSWLNYRSRSALLSDIYSLVLTFPLALTVIQVMLNPFSKGFKVTPKGTVSDRFSFNWGLALPLIILFIPTAISFWHNLGTCLVQFHQHATAPEIMQHFKGLGLGWIWSAYNLLMMGIALLILLDAPKPDVHEWFDLRRVVQIQIQEQESPITVEKPSPIRLWGVTTLISEVGAQVELTQAGLAPILPGETLGVKLEILEEELELSGQITRTDFRGEFPVVRVLFEEVNLAQRRRLVEMLFCRPGQWKQHCTPGEFQSLLLLFKILLKPRVLFDRGKDVSAVSVSKV